MARASLSRQLLALIKRNILIKSRNKGQVAAEVFFSIYMVLILAMVKYLTAPSTEAAIPRYPTRAVSTNVGSGRLYVSPDTTAVHSLMDNIITRLDSDGPIKYVLFGSKKESVNAYRTNAPHVIAGIDFTDGTLNSLRYTIRMNQTMVASTTSPWPGMCRGTRQNCMADRYLTHGFIAIQMAIDAALIELKAGVVNVTGQLVASTQKFPKGPWSSNFQTIQMFAATYLVLAFTPLISYMTVSVVAEKEKKIKESLRMVGMRDSAYWLSWGITYFVVVFVVVMGTVFIAAVTKLFNPASLFLFFLMLLLYGVSIITMSFMITPFFNKAQVAGVVAAMASFVTTLLYLVIAFTRTNVPLGQPVSSIPVVGQVFLCLLSPVALAMAVDQGIYLDIRYGGMTFDTLGMGQVPLYALLIMLLVDFVLYGLLAVYFDNVIPGEYGQKRGPLYFLRRDYWCVKKNQGEAAELISSRDIGNRAQSTRGHDTDRDMVEDVAQECLGKETIRMYNLCKVFTKDKNEVVAVDGMCLDIYEGQITALLGHNGAGKTTLINILTGLLPVTSGTATICGLDVSDPNAQEEIRTMTGVCPQQNVLFDDLTCHEHLMFYANLKGVAKDTVASHVAETLRDADLTEVRDTRATQLSGGQKRKLCVALALIADPKIIFMDEPTAGMDPFSRRHLWALLKSHRAGRVILLTTHFMDEADILADRKAFLSKGQLQCVGSSLFLKNRFGVGYHLGMVVDPSASVDGITQVVQSHVSEGKLDRSHGKELTYTLPIAAVGNFAGLFAELDRSVDDNTLGIKTYGVCMTTLEEVFLKIGVEEMEETDDIAVTDQSQADGDKLVAVTTHSQGHSGRRSLQRFWALCIVRFLILMRSKSLIVARIVLPLILIVGAVVLGRSLPSSPSTPADPVAKAIVAMEYIRQLSEPRTTYNPNMTVTLSGHGGPNSFERDFIHNLYSTFGISRYNESDDLLAEAPHHMGVNIHHIDFTSRNVSVNVTAMYNDSTIHSLPATVNVISNAVLEILKPTSNSIMVVSKPWPELSVNVAGFKRDIYSSVMLLGFGLSMIAPSFGASVVKDRQAKVRSQLRISGVSHAMYWLSTMFTDYLQYLFAATFAVIVCLVAQMNAMMTSGAIVSVILIFLTYMVSCMLAAYSLSFAFSKHETAQSTMTNIFIFSGLLPYCLVSIVDMLGKESTATLIHCLCVFLDPPYVLYGGLYYIQKIYEVAEKEQHGPPTVPAYRYFEWNSNIPVCWIASTVHIVVFFFVLRLLDVLSTGGSTADVFGVGAWWKTSNVLRDDLEESVIVDEDEDVLEERRRVRNWDMSDRAKAPVVLVRNLRKEFPRTSGICQRRPKEMKVAVCNNSFAVEAGEVLGLLGPNGAGKTTTLNMMIAEEGLTRGEVYIAGYDVRSSLSSAFENIGYCPQHDALWEEITLEEHLRCYATLQGYPSKERAAVIRQLLRSLHIEEHARKIAKNLSGGTKRKLSYAISMLGHPRVVLLDEPSTGMDPRSKRFLWDTISRSFASTERGAILTTHYMEEAESLCNRVAIMVNGSMQCIGTLQQLKSKFGQGYLLEVKLDGRGQPGEGGQGDRFEALDTFIHDIFTQATVVERFGERVTYRVPQSNVNSLSQTFAALEVGRQRLGIEDYSFSQSTLEQVFIEFAKHQYDDVAPGDSVNLSRTLSRQLSGQWAGEGHQHEADTPI